MEKFPEKKERKVPEGFTTEQSRIWHEVNEILDRRTRSIDLIPIEKLDEAQSKKVIFTNIYYGTELWAVHSQTVQIIFSIRKIMI